MDIDKIKEELEKTANKEPAEIDLSNPVNGDTVIFLTSNDSIVRIGKLVSEFNCVVEQSGEVFYEADITDKWMIPINKVQETVFYNGKFEPALEKLMNMNSEDFLTKEIEDYISSIVVIKKGTLSDEKQFLIELFTRNVRNKKIDFKSYRFMMELLFESEDPGFDKSIDIRELNSICYNMYSIFNKISKETYDEIYGKLAEFNSPSNGTVI